MKTKLKIAAFITAIAIIVLVLLGLDIVKMEHIKELLLIATPVVTSGVIWIFKDDEVKAERQEKTTEIQKRKIAETQLNSLKMRGGKINK